MAGCVPVCRHGLRARRHGAHRPAAASRKAYHIDILRVQVHGQHRGRVRDRPTAVPFHQRGDRLVRLQGRTGEGHTPVRQLRLCGVLHDHDNLRLRADPDGAGHYRLPAAAKLLEEVRQQGQRSVARREGEGLLQGRPVLDGI